MPCLILDPKVKSLCLVSLFIGCEGVNIGEEYHKWTSYPIILKWYHYLQPIASWLCRSNNKCKLWFKFFWRNSQPKWTSERTYDQGNVDFHYQRDSKIWSAFLNDGPSMKPCFLLLFFCMLDPKDCCVTNRNSKDFFFGKNIYKH